jgi:hypothetical protein
MKNLKAMVMVEEIKALKVKKDSEVKALKNQLGLVRSPRKTINTASQTGVNMREYNNSVQLSKARGKILS